MLNRTNADDEFNVHSLNGLYGVGVTWGKGDTSDFTFNKDQMQRLTINARGGADTVAVAHDVDVAFASTVPVARLARLRKERRSSRNAVAVRLKGSTPQNTNCRDGPGAEPLHRKLNYSGFRYAPKWGNHEKDTCGHRKRRLLHAPPPAR